VRGLRKYTICFGGLADGKHNFMFDIDKTFFDLFDLSEIKIGKLTAEVNLIKEPQVIEMEFFINGMVNVICDRCLDQFDLPVQYRGQLFFKFGKIPHEVSDEIIILSTGQTEINIAQYLYEFIHLSLPYRKIHPDIDGKSGCNPDMIKKLDSLIVKRPGNEKYDVRWDKLNEITHKN
jgi:uncharacterized protein